VGLGTGTNTTPNFERSPQQRWDESSFKYTDPDLVFNAFPHQREGQNVLYNDGHVKFETTANVGVDNDNIWTRWGTLAAGQTRPTAKQREVGDGTNGVFTRRNITTGAGGAAFFPTGTLCIDNVDDAFLINEHQDSGLTGAGNCN
jgi:prepilin-type processing-associated H-X9-DG protein